MKKLGHLRLERQHGFSVELIQKISSKTATTERIKVARNLGAKSLGNFAFSFISSPISRSDVDSLRLVFKGIISEKMKEINPDNNDKPFYWRVAK